MVCVCASHVYVVSHLSMKSDICCGLCMCESCLCGESSVNSHMCTLWLMYVVSHVYVVSHGWIF